MAFLTGFAVFDATLLAACIYCLTCRQFCTSDYASIPDMTSDQLNEYFRSAASSCIHVLFSWSKILVGSMHLLWAPVLSKKLFHRSNCSFLFRSKLSFEIDAGGDRRRRT
jgi:hypothetical protein